MKPESCGVCEYAKDNAPGGRKFCTKQPVPGATMTRPPIMNFVLIEDLNRVMDTCPLEGK